LAAADDDVIDNSGDLQHLEQQFKKLHQYHLKIITYNL
jgi:dephospho-CoA kinase